ncbi:MAG: DoxX family membrane protein [Bacteroidetes bacterium]|nr:DoxX family membrane protein [Bacteroidota bacterium]MCH8524676.1 DoxX family membrane protein [Balneolales bacterium]
MKRTFYTVVRLLLALIFIPSAFISLFLPPSEMGLSAEATQIVENLWAIGYLMYIVKTVELVAGIMFLTNRYVKLACIIIMPVVVNILMLALFKDWSGLFLSIPMFLMVLYLVKENWDSYKFLLLPLGKL